MTLVRALAMLVATSACAAACNDIEARRISNAPLNSAAEFPCERYVETPVKAVPSEGRCIVTTQPTFDYAIVVHVPETSEYAAGHTFVLFNTEQTVSGSARVLKLPVFGSVTGIYNVTQKVIDQDVKLPPEVKRGLPGLSIPVRAAYAPVGRGNVTYDRTLPLDIVFASSQVVDLQGPSVEYLRSLPLGKWKRVFEPEPPYDEYFPPHVGDVEVKRSGSLFDVVAIGGVNGDLDDLTGTSRDAVITRAEGLDDWKVWLEDHATGQRISVVKKLSGPRADKRLDTVGRGTSLEGVDAIVAPPDGSIAIPRLVTPLLAGQGLGALRYPELRAPVALEGIVAGSADGGVFLAVASRVTFESESITLPNGGAQSLLHYSATVSTDDRGRFATVLPPGTYDITVLPLEGTGFASFNKQAIIEDRSPINLSPPRRTRVRGLALLTDGRAAARAEVLAVPEPLADTGGRPTPAPARTRVRDDGGWSLDLDQGAYLFTVIPEAGTGFPRVLTRAVVPAGEADIGIVRIPPPTRLELEIRDPTTLARPIFAAQVRIFATPEGGGGPALEIGNGITNGAGRVEILLAQPRK